MIADLKRYEEYKDSGIQWMGDVPRHWSIEPGFAGLRQKKVKNLGMVESTVLSLSYGSIVVKPPEKLHGLVPESFETYQIVDPGDLIVRSTDLQNDWNSKRIGLVRIRGIITSAYLCFQTTDAFESRYAHQLLHAYDLMKVFYGLGSGLRQNLDWTDFKRLKILLPPLGEQALIVRFLDWASVRLGKAIAAKRKVIGLLEEQQKAIIQTSIDEVCESGCTTIPIRALLRPVKRLGFPKQELLSLFRDYGVVPKDSRENKNADVRDLALCQLVNPGDVVMNKMKAWQGSIAVSNLEGIVSPDYMVLKFLIQPVVPLFFHYALRAPSMVTNYRRVAYGVRPGQWRLMYPDFAMPSLKRQQEVVDRIITETETLESAIARIHREIVLLREYQTRLISDVVTGKLDVREFAESLPDDVSEEAAELAATETLDEDFATDDELIEEAV